MFCLNTVPSMNEPFVKYVEERLQQWAEWYSSGNWYGLGYPSCSIEYRLMTEGILVKATGPNVRGTETLAL